MCGRFTLRTPTKTLASLFDGLRFPELGPRYNIAPTQDVVCVRQSAEGNNEAAMLRWGLVPFWSKDVKIGARMINARSETAATKPAFRSAFKSRRCLVLADGFYEWKKVGKEKQPYYITRVDDGPFCLAGLWESWQEKKPDDAQRAGQVESCTVLTTAANSMMASLHDRMPVILPKEQYEFWLDVEFKDRQRLESLLVPCPDDELQARPVSKLVNKATHDQPECIAPLKGESGMLF
jgi:putative SOS response-associated peptidase YedK